jgi:hypothetical protein
VSVTAATVAPTAIVIAGVGRLGSRDHPRVIVVKVLALPRDPLGLGSEDTIFEVSSQPAAGRCMRRSSVRSEASAE